MSLQFHDQSSNATFYDPATVYTTFTVDDFPTSIQANAAFNITISGTAEVPTNLNTQIRFDGASGPLATINSINNVGGYVINATFPPGVNKQYTNTNEIPLYIQVGAEAATPGNTSFVPDFGYDFVNIGTPSLLEGSVFFNHTGDAPTTGGQVVYQSAPSPNPDNLTITVRDTGEWVIDGTPTQDFTFDAYYIGSDDVVGATGTFSVDTIDEIPDQFTFTDQTDVELNTAIVSNTITVQGVQAGLDIQASISGGEYAVDAGAGFGGYTSTQTNVQLGNQIRVRGISSASYGVTNDVAFSLNGVSDTFSITTRAADITPDAFTFTDSSGNEPSTVVESNSITISGVDSGVNVPVTVTNGEYAVDSGSGFGAFISTASNVQLGDIIKVRGTSSATFGGTVNVTLTAGGVSDTFSINTRAAVAPTVQTQPTNQAVTQGQTATFNAVFTNATSFQWYDASDDSVLIGETATNLSIATQLSDNGNTYYCVATNDGLTAQTNTVTLTVVETDVTGPVITLLGDNPLSHPHGVAYSDPGATAFDNFDGDVTGNIVVTGNDFDVNALGSYTVRYNVTDSSGNAATEVTRTVNVTDQTAPVITLRGGSTIYINQFSTYDEQGATWTDAIDGTGDAVVSGDTVDTSTVGTYVKRYNYTDSAGNAAVEVVRLVIVNVIDTGGPDIVPFNRTATWQGNVIPNLVIGDTYRVSVTLNSNGSAYDASSATSVKCCVVSEDNGEKLTSTVDIIDLTNADTGSFEIILPSTVTSELSGIIEKQTLGKIEMQLTLAGETYTWFGVVRLIPGYIA